MALNRDVYLERRGSGSPARIGNAGLGRDKVLYEKPAAVAMIHTAGYKYEMTHTHRSIYSCRRNVSAIIAMTVAGEECVTGETDSGVAYGGRNCSEISNFGA